MSQAGHRLRFCVLPAGPSLDWYWAASLTCSACGEEREENIGRIATYGAQYKAKDNLLRRLAARGCLGANS
jgi:hypothetical protein